METLKKFRARYGFTQQVAANMLDINLAQLALAETGKRSLPFRAIEKMRALEEIAENAAVEEENSGLGDYTKFIKQEYQKTRNELFKYVKDCDHKLLTLQRKLAPLQEKRTNALLSLALISHLRLISSLSKGEMISIKKAESDLKRTLKLVPQSTIDKLNFEIGSLEFVSDKIERKIGELNILLEKM